VRRTEEGAAVVEFALVLPLLTLLVFGMLEFGRGYNAKLELTSAVREGARAVALAPLGTDTTTVTQLATTTTRGAAPGLTATSITVTPPTPCTTLTGNVTVTATYPFTYSIPFFGNRSVTLTAKGVMRCGG
jgi:Flp pilus assembly protein TadG